MNSIILSILSIYLFILIGYMAKKIFHEKIDDKTITILNVYFLQVFLTFWGLLVRPVDMTLCSKCLPSHRFSDTHYCCLFCSQTLQP